MKTEATSTLEGKYHQMKTSLLQGNPQSPRPSPGASATPPAVPISARPSFANGPHNTLDHKDGNILTSQPTTCVGPAKTTTPPHTDPPGGIVPAKTTFAAPSTVPTQEIIISSQEEEKQQDIGTGYPSPYPVSIYGPNREVNNPIMLSPPSGMSSTPKDEPLGYSRPN